MHYIHVHVHVHTCLLVALASSIKEIISCRPNTFFDLDFMRVHKAVVTLTSLVGVIH